MPRPVAADRDDKRPPVGGIAAQRSRNVITVHSRKSDIEQDDLGAILRRDAQRLGAVARGAHLVVHQAEQRGEAVRGIGIVVHDQDAVAGERCRLGFALRRAIRFCPDPRTGNAGQPHHELASFPHAVTVYGNGAPVQFDQSSH